MRAKVQLARPDDVGPEDVVRFWTEELTPKDWYAGGAALDDTIRSRFGSTWEAARKGAVEGWVCGGTGALAYILLTDQFPRNMFRDDARAFATDGLARKAAIRAINQSWDMRIPEPARQFFFLPLMHSETTMDQDRCVRLFLTRMPETGADNLLHARAHREVIRRFGRFPYRNAVLGRVTRPDEAAFLQAGGYGAMVRELEAAA
jgi:uncharacterized protein (DUF924 family)